jgi:hypothetical protein
MNNKIAYDVYRGTSDRTLRLATMPAEKARGKKDNQVRAVNRTAEGRIATFNPKHDAQRQGHYF